MKLFWKIYIVVFLYLFTLFSSIKAQDEPIYPEQQKYFPEYESETLNKSEIEDDIIFPLVFNGYLYSFSLSLKLPIWRLFIGGDLVNPFLIEDSHIYLYDIYNRVYSIDIKKGETLWKINIENEIKGKPLFYENYIIVSTLNGNIYVIDVENGEIVYKYTGTGEIYAGLSLYENLIIVPYKNGEIIAYNVEKNCEEWVFRSGGIISIAPVIKDGILFFGAWDDTLYALDVRSGKAIWISYIGQSITREFLIFNNEIIIFLSRGEIQSIDRTDGNIKWVKYMKNVEFSYNYFSGNNKVLLFMPDLIAINPLDGSIIFNYRERAFNLYKEMLFDSMVEGEHPLSDEERIKILSDVYFTVSNYPILPPVEFDNEYVYFVTEDLYLYIYDLKKDFFIVKFKMS